VLNFKYIIAREKKLVYVYTLIRMINFIAFPDILDWLGICLQ